MKNKVIRKVGIELTSKFLRLETGYNVNVSGWTSIDGGKTFYYCGHGKYCKNIKEAINWARNWRE